MGTVQAQAPVTLSAVDLPPFPGIAIKVLQMVSRDDVRAKDLHELICRDPAFTSELLKISNSPLYGIRSEIKSTLQAIMLLGFERVKGLALTVGAKGYLSKALETPILRGCWRHSLATGLLAEKLAKAAMMDKDVCYTAGFMHDIGRLALIAMKPQMYAQLLETATGSSCDLLNREREQFGMDHCKAGESLVTAWKLPSMFLEITSKHHVARTESKLTMLAVVQLSCLLADSLGYGVAKTLQSRSYEDLLLDIPERERQQWPTQPQDLAVQLADKINCIESF